MASEIQQKNNTKKVSKTDAKSYNKLAKMASKINEKSIPKFMLKKGFEKVWKTGNFRTLRTMKLVVFLQENSYFNEINVFQRMQKEYEKIFKKTCQNASKYLYKFNRKSASEKERQNDAKMLENWSQKTSPNRQKAHKVEVQKSIEKKN